MPYETYLTTAGRALINEFHEGTVTLKVTNVALGSGTQSDPVTATGLASPKGNAAPASVTVQGAFAIITALYTNANVASSFVLTELGVFAKPVRNGVEEAEILYAYVKVTDGGTIPAASSPIRRKIVVNVFVDTATTVTATIIAGDVESHNVDVDAHQNLWIPGAFRGNCSTKASTAAKTTTIPKFYSDGPRQGCLIVLKCTTANTALAPTLNVNSKGAHSIVSIGKESLDAADYWKAGEWVLFQYDGAYWVLLMRLGTFIPASEKAQPNGVATLASDGKVVASQLRGGFVVSPNAPSDTSMLWIDTFSRMRYYDGDSWEFIVPTWGDG